MAIDQIVSLLLQERDRLNAAIAALTGEQKRRGRPAKNTAAVATTATPEIVSGSEKPKGRKKRSAAQRKAQAARMKAYWAKKKKAA